MSMMLKKRMEAMKEIIEADTDPMKEVLCLEATIAPTQQIMLSNLVQPRRETMKEIIEADPMREVLHLRATFGPRRETMKEIIKANTDPKKAVLRLRRTF